MKQAQVETGDCLLIVAGHMGLTATVIVRRINEDGTIWVNGRTNTNVVFDDQWFVPSKRNILQTISHFDISNLV